MFKILFIILTVLHISASTFATNCTTPNGEHAQCISIFSCKRFLSVLSNATEETINFIKKSECGCSMVCCGTCTGFQLEVKSKSVNFQNQNNLKNYRRLPTRNICGFQHTDDRFYDKNVTAIDEFPWLVQLRYKNEFGQEIGDKCSGTLINRRYVLTSAYCAEPPLAFGMILYQIRLGEYDRVNATDCVDNPDFEECTDGIIDIDIEEVTFHSKYIRGRYAKENMLYNIALIRMKKHIEFSEFIRPICLPTSGYPNATLSDTVISSGWGRVIITNEDQSRIKKRTPGKMLSEKECYAEFSKYEQLNFTFDNRFYCVKEQDIRSSSCSGDTGGAVMFQNSKLQWQQEGIISSGYGCGSLLTGNIKVSAYFDWILENIKKY